MTTRYARAAARLCATTVFGLLFADAPAKAEGTAPAENERESTTSGEGSIAPAKHRQWSVGIDTTFHTQSPGPSVTTVVAPVVSGALWLRPVMIEAEFPLLYYHVRRSDDGQASGIAEDSGFVPGNPTVTASYRESKEGMEACVGLGVALPISRIDSDDPNAFVKAEAYRAAIATRGGWNIWWYSANSLAFFLPGGVRSVSRVGLDLGLQAALAVFVYTGSGSSPPLAAYQFGAHLGYANRWFQTGVRLRGTGPSLQTSLEPYVEVVLGPSYVGGGFIYNIDNPYGPSFDAGGFWGVRIDAGVKF